MVAPIKLARLPENWQDQPVLVRRYFDETLTALEKAINDIIAIPAIQTALSGLNTAVTTAQAAAVTAQTAANTAQTAATAAATESSIVDSFPTGYTAPLVSITSTGLVTIANHQRQYGNSTLNPTVSVTSGILATTATAGQSVRIYYDDALRAGGVVTYHYTIDPAAPPVQGGNRHVVGAALVPGAGTSPGFPVRPAGWVDTA